MIEDDIVSEIIITKLLEKRGLEVTIAEGGNIAVQKTLTRAFDLILMDMQMPNMDGYETTMKLREEGITTPIVALTAYAMKRDREKCIEAGCDDYLSKPIDQDELRRVLCKYVSAKKQERLLP